jgi:hypothetical protein
VAFVFLKRGKQGLVCAICVSQKRQTMVCLNDLSSSKYQNNSVLLSLVLHKRYFATLVFIVCLAQTINIEVYFIRSSELIISLRGLSESFVLLNSSR